MLAMTFAQYFLSHVEHSYRVYLVSRGQHASRVKIVSLVRATQFTCNDLLVWYVQSHQHSAQSRFKNRYKVTSYNTTIL